MIPKIIPITPKNIQNPNIIKIFEINWGHGIIFKNEYVATLNNPVMPLMIAGTLVFCGVCDTIIQV